MTGSQTSSTKRKTQAAIKDRGATVRKRAPGGDDGQSQTSARTKRKATERPAAARGGHMPSEGRRRVIIEDVRPSVDGGRFPVKRVIGEEVVVEANIFTDGHDRLRCVLQHRRAGAEAWNEEPMEPLVNDEWTAAFTVTDLGVYEYQVVAWVDHFETWRQDLLKKHEAGQDVAIELLAGANLVEQTADRAGKATRAELMNGAEELRGDAPIVQRVLAALSEGLADRMAAHADRTLAVDSGTPLRVQVDPVKARFSSWYEMFPRSASPAPDRHGTFKDVETRLPYVAGMGFDVLYLPPIHPIGHTYRKGRNNALKVEEDDTGSPWAIGSAEGGHKSVHPELGTIEDFDALVAAARGHGIEVALDIAFQCSPDHPYVTEHPEWFRKRPDGSIQYAENPPKKYQDIYPFDFETDDWESLWAELKSIFDFWIEHGVKIFRVDNPHTKAFPFWEWAIGEIKHEHPDVIFLSEAFTRPKVMYRLAKLGFTQSYTYFAWRNLPWELEQYFTELTRTNAVEFFRPNAWPNTPDILTEYLQLGGRPASIIRLVLAATLCANYGMYGPPFELGETTPRVPGGEEYLDSEKYQRHVWDLDRPDSLGELIGRVNRIRRENPALQQDRTLHFHGVDNPNLICYSKVSADRRNVVFCVVNTNPHGIESGTTDLDLDALGIDRDTPFQVHDLITGARYLWSGPRNFVRLDPGVLPAHVMRIRRHVRNERDFDYYM